MNREELAQAIQGLLHKCAGFEGDEIAKGREQALDYYFQRARGDEVIGRSQVVSGDLSAMVEANLAQMLDAFSGDELVEFAPSGPEDEIQAQLESDTVTDFIMGRNNGYLQFAAAIKDALLCRNGILKVYVDDTATTRTESYTGVTAEGLAGLLKEKEAAGVECVVQSHKFGELRLRCTYRERVFKAEAIPVENFLYVQDWDSLDLQPIPFCAEYHVDSRSRLLELGFPKAIVAKLPRFQQRTGSYSGAARNPRKALQDSKAIDPSQELVEWFECYLLIDQDGDGISERRKVCYSSAQVLEDAPASLVPFAAGTAILNPHRFLGVSLFDKLKQVQDLNTGLNRALMDNVNTTTKNRLAVLDGAVNPEDTSDGRPNGVLRVKRSVQDVRQAIMPLQVPDTSANILANIQHQNTVRTEMGGASLDLASGNMQLGDRVGSEGVDRAYSVMEQLAAMMTKIAAMSLVRSTYLLAHATLREWFTTPVHIKREGKWIAQIPSQWPARLRATVKPGMSPGERQRKANALQTLMQSQVMLAERGMDEILVNLEGYYALQMDWARAAEIRNPERYFVDPASPAAQKALEAKQAAAKEADEQKKALMQQAIALEQLRTAFSKYKQDTDLQFKYWEATLGAEVEEAKITGAAAVDLVKAKRSNGAPPAEAAGKQNGSPPGR